MQDSNALSSDQRRSLRCLAEMMIPASAEYGVPSAADDEIFADLGSLGRNTVRVLAVLCTVDEMSAGVFADLEPARRAMCRNGRSWLQRA